MTPEHVQSIEKLLGFLVGQRVVGRTPAARREAIELHAALQTMYTEYNIMLQHVNSCPIVASDLARQEAKDNDNVPMRTDEGDVSPPH